MNRKIKLFIAMSLDGFIAMEDGNVDWLQGQEPEYEGIDPYSEFMKEIDTIIMGNKTYEQIINELSKNVWPYKGLETYVITHHKRTNEKEIHFVDESPLSLVKRLLNKPGKDIWICGGSNLVNQMMKDNLIDVYHITLIPTILGKGIRLFENNNPAQKIKLINSQNYNGFVECIYEKLD